jgi:hypothetical protein
MKVLPMDGFTVNQPVNKALSDETKGVVVKFHENV